VSVTQSFNTTGSMGKLMLNVLLSFAQFEREVTGERIRDKIAASKAKGMWMGGTLPLGYDRPADDSRILQVNERDADTVRHIFARYLDLGSVHALQRELDERGILSKQWTTTKGKPMGGQPFSRGALFHLLRNRLYRGKIAHKGEVHEGGHAAIVEEALFESVQQHLDANARRHRARARGRAAQALLTGKLFDAAGEPMSPTTSRGNSGKRYRYYVSASLQKGAGKAGPDRVLIAALRKAHAMLARERGMPVIAAAPVSPYDRMVLRLAFLAPNIQRAIIEGRQPRHSNLECFKSVDLPLAWSVQRKLLGFGEN